MLLACQACQARYRIADEKVHGKIVKIRCKKCGAIVVADGSEAAADRAEPPAAAPARTGERHEQSVLFSLSALQRPQPREVVPPVAAEPSGLIDLRMLSAALSKPPSPREGSDAIAHLGTGAFAPLFVADYEPAREARRPRFRASFLMPFAALAVVGVFTFAHSLGVVAKSSRPAVSSTPAPVPTIPAASAPPSADRSSVPTPPLAASEEAAAPMKAKAVVSHQPRAAAGVSATPGERAWSCCPGEDGATCEMRRSIGKACAGTMAANPSAFDAVAAGRALGAVDLRRCAAGAPAEGHARVTFQPSGAVSGVVLDTPDLVGTGAERCVAEAYRRVEIAAFTGPALTVGKRFRLGPGA